MIELPPVDDRNFCAIRQRVINSSRAIRATASNGTAGYVPLALVQAGVSELVRIYGRDAVSGLLAELAGELGNAKW